jgi:hypothetical protein
MNTKNSTEKQYSYRQFSNSVLSKREGNNLFERVNFTKIKKMERMKLNSSLYIKCGQETTKKKFKDPAPTLGNWDRFLLKNLKQEKCATIT